MKNILFLILGLFAVGVTPTFADGGGGDYEDLLAIYIDEDYHKLVDKAMKYVENDKTKRHPVPYIYVSMGYYEMSKDGKYRDDENFKNYQKYALKYAYKFRSKDKEAQYWDEYQNFISELRTTVLEDAENQLDEIKTLKKSFAIYKYLVKIDPEDGTAWFMKGYCELMLNVPTEAAKSFNKAMPLINKVGDVEDDLAEEQAKLLRFELMLYADYLMEKGSSDSASRVIDVGTPLFEDEIYIKKIDEIKAGQ